MITQVELPMVEFTTFELPMFGIQGHDDEYMPKGGSVPPVTGNHILDNLGNFITDNLGNRITYN